MRKHAVKYIVQKASVERFGYDKGTNAATRHKQPAENYIRQRQMTPGTKRAMNGLQYSYNIRTPSRNLLSDSCDARFRTRATHNEKKISPQYIKQNFRMHRRAAYMDDRSGYSHSLDFVCLE